MSLAASTALYVKHCPACHQPRPVEEPHCETVHPDGSVCGWSLMDVDLQPAGATPLSPFAATAARSRHCVNGHALDAGDYLCMVCGADPAPDDAVAPMQVAEPVADEPTAFGEWTAVQRLTVGPDEPWERFLVSRSGIDAPALLTLYRVGFEPDPAVHEALRRMPLDHIPELLATGRLGDRAYEVIERIECGSLADAGWFAADRPDVLTRIVDELGRALADFAEIGLRHRDIRPATILLRTREPLDLVITGFGSARLSDFDLEAVAPLELTRYSAPEAIVGAVSAASDWWSLGMLVLEQATAGACFTGINDQAFRLHVVTRGITLPPNLDPRLQILLRGLLTRDPLQRWSGREVQDWLAGKSFPAPAAEPPALAAAEPITLAGQRYRRPDQFALAAAEAANWKEARELTLRGSVATWLATAQVEPRMEAEVRRLTSDGVLSNDLRHALALMAMNAALPLTIAGEIVTPAWLLAHPAVGYGIITGETVRHLERMDREAWLVRLGTRVGAVAERARQLEIALDDERLRVALLATSRANLDAERGILRRLFPDTDHPGLAGLLERARLTDEELIILVSAAAHQFVPLASLTDAAMATAGKAGVAMDADALPELLVQPRREIFQQVDARTANFARCGIELIDAWADSFRVERRLPLDRAATLLSVPAAAWEEPPRQQYVATLLELFEKRVSAAIGRGPLVRFILGKTTARLDLTELGSALRPAEALLNHVLSRVELKTDLDANTYLEDPAREARFRRLVSHAETFRRDTGIDSRYLAFPFLTVRSGEGVKPRLAPVLLWPVAVELQSGAAPGATLMFDRDREEVRLNPALEAILGPEAFVRWRSARDELLGREAIRLQDVMDVFGALAVPRGRSLTPLPGKDAAAPIGSTLVPAAALFNAEFTGQAVAGDLQQMRRRPPAGTALEAVLRVAATPAEEVAIPPAPELERFITVESDPSQDLAVLRARRAPGLLVEGPPGTGKSQTIVNIISDAIGRGETVLVVCQKQAALRVVEKRLQAEGLGDRLFLVSDINRDRAAILAALREQVDAVRGAPAGRAAALRRSRSEKAARIEVLEREVDRYHEALHAADEQTGLTYRELIGELIGVEAAGSHLTTAALRPLLAPLDRGGIAALDETCAPLVRLWLDANYEDSPLAALQRFAVDEAVTEGLHAGLAAFAMTERLRDDVVARGPPMFDLEEVEPHQAWLDAQAGALRELPDAARADLRAWFGLFQGSGTAAPRSQELIAEADELERELGALDPSHHDASLFSALNGLPEPERAARFAAASMAVTPAATFMQRLSLARWRSRRATRAFLAGLGHAAVDADFRRLAGALALEGKLRPLRQRVGALQQALSVGEPNIAATLHELRQALRALAAALASVSLAAAAILAAPRRREAEAIAEAGTRAAVDKLLAGYELAFARLAARQASAARLNALAVWFDPAWMASCASAIEAHASNQDRLATIVRRLPELAAYQRFRARAAGLSPETLQVFACLRPHAAAIAARPASEREGLVQRTLQRESLLAWKTRFEGQWPELGFEQEEIARKVASLAILDAEMRTLNRQLLIADIDAGRLGTAAAWESITRLRGARALRLREVLDQGADLGLMRLRPVWLMNPDVASRLLPLKPGLFDVVIFDEASQMPVEHATPSLFRARRAVISGDEKQMPPSSFFSSRIDGDDDEPDAGNVEETTDAERAAHEEHWNRWDVQSCPDLLQLGRSVLPVAALQIHYRSAYRELIGYSNAAFYKHTLNVPARHPDDEVRRAAPIEVLRVDGVYEEQTNPAEAERVVAVLERLWAMPADQRPSVGVVTFNRKQADCVEDVIRARADEDPAFRQALLRERDRTQRGEDMGFFVKNVENVQGDERDVIIFSTTFGRNHQGMFRRSFGVLGQAGGERRLNVAVTRARDKVILITSMPVNDVSDWLAAGRAPASPRDYLQAYLDYAAKISRGDLDAARNSQGRLGQQARRVWRNGADGPDGFATSVAAFIRSLGHRPIVAAQDGDAFGLDFAIEHPETGLFGIGIECDAPRHPLLAHARAREIWRPAVLGRSVPRLHRVSSVSWYGRRAEEEARLRRAVEEAMKTGLRA